MFKITQSKGFGVRFSNGWYLSVQWGPFNYCEKHNYKPGSYEAPTKEDWECENAEIAAWHGSSSMVPIGGDTVVGYVTPDQVAVIMAGLSKLPPGAEDSKATAIIEKVLDIKHR